MNADHTPGPWLLAEVVENRFQRTEMRRVRSAQEGDEHGAVCEVYGIRDGSVAAANAHLIAAAPDLLAALRELYAQVRGECSWMLDDTRGGQDGLATRCESAIAKATRSAA